MKTRLSALFLLFTLLLPRLCAAEAYDGRARVCALGDRWDNQPVATLYAQADASSDALALLFEGTWLDVVSDDGGPFVRVRCGAYEGYVLRLALTPGISGMDDRVSDVYAFLVPALPQVDTPLLSAPAPDADVLARIPMDETVCPQFILGDWMYVTYGDQTGYVPAADARHVGNWSYLAPSSPEQRIRVYAAPEEGAALLGEYYGYLSVANQFDADANWARVRIGSVSGYVHAADTASGSIIATPFLPPTADTPAETTLYTDSALTTPLETVPAGTTLQLLGVCQAQDAYPVCWGAMYAFVRRGDLPDAPQRAAWNPRNDLCEAAQDTLLYDDFSSPSNTRRIDAGTRFYLLDSGYIYGGKEAAWVYLPDTAEMGYIASDGIRLVTPGEEETNDLDPLLMGYRRLYACKDAVLRDAPSDDATALYTFTDWDDPYYLLGGVLPNGYIHVRSVDDAAREGYILAKDLDVAHW